MVRYARVGAFANRGLAELALTYLHDNGVDAMVFADDAGGTYPHVALLSGGISLRVREEDEALARELLAQADQGHARLESADDAGAPLRPAAKWMIRIAAAAVVAGIAMSTLPSR